MKRIVKYAAVMAFVSGVPWLGLAQPYLIPQGVENRITGPQLGDQTHPQAAINRSGGIVVWQDNTGTNGALRVKALRLDVGLAAAGTICPLDEFAPGDQENPQATLLSGGNALVVWQGGPNGSQKIFSQILGMGSPEAGAVAPISSASKGEQITPAVASLPDGNAFAAWASRDQDGDMLGVFARRVAADGQPLGGEIQVNQFNSFNQRTPDVVTLNNGNVLVAWVSEQQRGPRTLDIFGRLFSASGAPLSAEFLMNDSTNLCANPVLSPTADGGVVLAWSQKDHNQTANGWDVYARLFDATLQPKGSSFAVNTRVYGDQYGPKLATVGGETLVVWTSLVQDGDWQGVFGQYVDAAGQKLGAEFQVNTTNIRNQMEPAVVSDSYRRVLAVWTSYIQFEVDFDLMAQQFVSTQVAAEIKLTLSPIPSGLRIHWNAEPNSAYQVQTSPNCVLWNNLGTPRVAATSAEFIDVELSKSAFFYRVVKMPNASN